MPFISWKLCIYRKWPFRNRKLWALVLVIEKFASGHDGWKILLKTSGGFRWKNTSKYQSVEIFFHHWIICLRPVSMNQNTLVRTQCCFKFSKQSTSYFFSFADTNIRWLIYNLVLIFINIIFSRKQVYYFVINSFSNDIAL